MVFWLQKNQIYFYMFKKYEKDFFKKRNLLIK